MEWQREAINQSFVPHKTDGGKRAEAKNKSWAFRFSTTFLSRFLVFEAQKGRKSWGFPLKLKLRGSSTTRDSPAHSTFLLHGFQCPADWRYFQLFFLIFSHTNKKAQQLLKSHEFNEKYQKFHLSIVIFMLFHFSPQLSVSHAVWRENQNFLQLKSHYCWKQTRILSSQHNFLPIRPRLCMKICLFSPIFFFLASPRLVEINEFFSVPIQASDLRMTIWFFSQLFMCAGDKMYNSNDGELKHKKCCWEENLSILWLRPCRPSGGESENNYKREFNFHAKQQIDELS